MNAELPNLFEAIDEFLRRFEKWQEPIRTYQAENFARLNKDGYTWTEFERGLKAIAASQRGAYDPQPELNSLLGSLCSSYLGGNAQERNQIRAFVAERRALGGLLWSHANSLSTKINGPDDIPLLKLALAAISIENCGSDYRDTLMALADLYVRAEDVGVDPKPLFSSVSELSTNAPTRGGCASLADMLRKFESYAVVSERRGRGRPYHEGF